MQRKNLGLSFGVVLLILILTMLVNPLVSDAFGGVYTYDTGGFYDDEADGYYWIEYGESPAEGQIPCFVWNASEHEYDVENSPSVCYDLTRVRVDYTIEENSDWGNDTSGTVYMDLSDNYQDEELWFHSEGGDVCYVRLIHNDYYNDHELSLFADSWDDHCEWTIDFDIWWQWYWPW